MNRRLLVILLSFLAAGPAWGRSSPADDQAEQVKALLERVELLEKRVAELEGKQGASAMPLLTAAEKTTAQKSEPQGATASTVQTHDHMAQEQAVAQQAEVHYPSLQVRGFADVDFSGTDQKGAKSGFNLGQLDLHLASPLSRKISYFAEMTFNAHPTDYTVEVERSIIRYDYNDYFKLSFGRYHTPIGYWNTAFHHGAWLETSIDRPEIVKVGGTFIPIHFVGFLAEGNIPSGGAGLSYSFGVGDGRGETISRPGDAGDINNNRAWVANIFARPVKLYGFQFGASVYRDKITCQNNPLVPVVPGCRLTNGKDYREWITSAHVVWTKGAPEFLAEIANVSHRQVLTNRTSNSQGLYAQLGYRLPWFENTLKPYYRFEYLHTPPSDAVFLNLDLVESIVGLRYDISSYAAFKSEYRHVSRNVLQTPTFDGIVNGLFVQTSFTF
ncbi:MAG: porin [Candidatus Acidiferrales bacterium]